jgi:hypothetical protein
MRMGRSSESVAHISGETRLMSHRSTARNTLRTTVGAWRAAVQRQYALHRLLMRFSYAMTFGA